MDMLAREAREALLQRSRRLRARAGASEEAGGIRLTDADRRELRDIESALARIDQGEFGRCAQCGGAIGRHRLRAIPEARHCMSCAAVERERAAQP